MGLTTGFLTVLLVTLVSASDLCPSKELLAPCSCDGTGISCIGPYDETQLRKSLHGDFKVRVVQSVWVQATKLTTIPVDLFNYIKAEHFYVELNSASTVWNMNAFWVSNEIVQTISLYENMIVSLPFANLRNYKKLRTFNFGRNRLEKIENNAFTNPNLTTLILSNNRINSIGTNAFRDLPSLQWLDLDNNFITTLGPLSLKCNTLSSVLKISLVDNLIASVDKSALENTTPYRLIMSKNRLTSLPESSFFSLITRMAPGQSKLTVSDNRFSCKGCDYTWVVQHKQTAARILVGFKCPHGTGVNELTRARIGC